MKNPVPLLAMVFMALSSVTSVRINNICTKDARRCIREMSTSRTNKVCGTNGVTYKNICLLEMKACMDQTPIMIAYEGPCRPRLASNPRNSQRYDQDHKDQFPQQQQQEEQGVGGRRGGGSSSDESDDSSEERRGGARPSTRAPLQATATPTRRIIYDRVTIPSYVTDDGSTSVSQSTMIPMTCPDVCPIQDQPVCGSDGNTYPSPCLLKAEACFQKEPRLTAVYAGACIPVCGNPCESVYDPVCGTDGVTYNSRCVLDQTSCQTEDEELTVAYRGECFNTLRDRGCEQECEDIIQPICTNTGMTFKSRCEFERYQCVAGDTSTWIESLDGCPGTSLECYEDCPDVDFPVCASNNVTYPSLCEYAVANCKDSNVTYEYSGPCIFTTPDPCDAECTIVMNQVCASNNETYYNRCFMDLAACDDPSIEFVRNGRCDEPVTSS